MCGAESSLVRARVEGTDMDLCKSCARFGEIIPKQTVRPKRVTIRTHRIPEELVVVPDFSHRIIKKRSALGLKQEELAMRVAEKASVIQKLENGSFTPPITLAKKLEKLLNIKLTEKPETEEAVVAVSASKSDGFTLGDFIRKR